MRASPFAFVPWIGLFACSQAFESRPDNLDPMDSGGVDSAETGDSGSADGRVAVAGVVTGERGLPLAGVTVTGGEDTVSTGADGAFSVIGLPPVQLEFTAGGRYVATRAYTAAAVDARVGLLPRKLGVPLTPSAGGTVVDGSASLLVPPGAIVDDGLVVVTFDALDLSAGATGLPIGFAAESGQVATVFGAAVVGVEGAQGEVSASTALTVSLPLLADSPGGSPLVLRAQGALWVDTGTTATTAYDGSAYVATFAVTEPGTYAVGKLGAAGCVSGVVVDGAGAPAAGALVRSTLRPVDGGPATYFGEAVTGADGAFCVPGTASGVTVLAAWTDSAGGHWSVATDASAAGTGEVCEDCNDLGSLQLVSEGCALGNLYAQDGGAMAPSWFGYGEGSLVESAEDSTLSLFVRAGPTFTLVGPGGIERTFSVTAGSTPELGNCTRLGNLQAPRSGVQITVESEGAGAAGAEVVSSQGETSTTGDDGEVCLPTDDGTVTFTGTLLRGAQAVSVASSVTLAAGNGSCEAGNCEAGPSLLLADPGCAEGVVLGEGGVPAAGITVFSSAWDSAVTGADGSFALTTGGAGRGAVWASGWGLFPFDDAPVADGCASLTLAVDAGAPPPLVVAAGNEVWRVNSDGSRTDIKNGTVVDVVDVVSDSTADLTLALLSTYAWAGAADGTGWTNFDFPSSAWSAVSIAPDGSGVALQGNGSSNSSVWIYEIDGSSRLRLSTSAGTDSDGLAWSPDSLWVASTRKDGGIEVTPAGGARGPTTIASSSSGCAHPVWFDTDSVALACGGAMLVYEMDGSSSVSWHSGAGDERIWAVTSTGRVVYTRDEELHVADRDDASDVTLYSGAAGTTFSRVRVSADGLWIAAIVTDGTGTDVLAVADQAPYAVSWRTSTPSEVEVGLDWPD